MEKKAEECVALTKERQVELLVEFKRLVKDGYLTSLGKAPVLYWHMLKQVLQELISLCTFD
jgi:hypothetical protein